MVMSSPCERLADEIRHHPPVVRVHPRAVGVEDADDADIHPIRAVIVHEQGFGRPLAFVVARPGANRIDRAAIGLRLGVDVGIAVDFAGRRLERLGAASLGNSQDVNRPQDGGLHRLDRIELVMAGGGGTGQVVDFIHFEEDRQRDVVADELEVWTVQQVTDVRFLAGEKAVHAEDVVSLFDQALAEVRAEEPGPAGHENSFER